MSSERELREKIAELEKMTTHVRNASLELTGSMLSAYKVLNDLSGLTKEQYTELGAMLDSSVKAINQLGKALPEDDADD